MKNKYDMCASVFAFLSVALLSTLKTHSIKKICFVCGLGCSFVTLSCLLDLKAKIYGALTRVSLEPTEDLLSSAL